MITKFQITDTFNEKSNIIIFSNNLDEINYDFTKEEQKYINKQLKNEEQLVIINRYEYSVFLAIIDTSEEYLSTEKIRNLGSKVQASINKEKIEEISIFDYSSKREDIEAFIEGFVLSNYQFIKYFGEEDKRINKLSLIKLTSKNINKRELDDLKSLCEGVYITRDLANEPHSGLNSEQLAEKIQELGKEAGFNVEVLLKKQIELLKMGGLLAVNQGSAYSPTFSILDWNPENAVNEKPYVLVGKGIVFDTGGLSIKPTKNSMDLMKFDMAGAASVIGAMYAIAKQKLPIHVIALIPATDNAVDAKSYVPGDVIRMHNNLTVEVLNTDAEGRLILADALSFARKYKPELVIDIATLTGAQVVAIGHQGIALMTNDEGNYKNKLINSGNNVYERLVELPIWDEYDELIKSDIADIKNIGGPEAGTITAAKFLQRFTDYKWAHLDIAGPSIYSKQEEYRTKGGSGVGTRLFVDFFKQLSNLKKK